LLKAQETGELLVHSSKADSNFLCFIQTSCPRECGHNHEVIPGLEEDQQSSYHYQSDTALQRTFSSLPAKENAMISLKWGAAVGGR